MRLCTATLIQIQLHQIGPKGQKNVEKVRKIELSYCEFVLEIMKWVRPFTGTD